MTTEDDFQKAFESQPRDWQTRLVFADWLQERDDPRAEGYRAMGMQQRAPSAFGKLWVWLNARWAATYNDTEEMRAATLPDDWYNLIPRVKGNPECAAERKSLAESLNDAAGAFAKLPPERRAELLVPGALPLPSTEVPQKKKAKSTRTRKK
jgi:uncharacterized protein (TIGR02996 family)